MEIRVNGTIFTGGTCSGGSGWLPDGESWPRTTGLEEGKPAQLSITALKAERWPEAGGREQVAMPEGLISLAVGERMTFEDYPFPPRPAELKELPRRMSDNRSADHLRRISSSSDPNAVVTTTMRWSKLVQYHADVLTPGRLRIEVNGVPIHEYTSWDYEGGGSMGYASASGLTTGLGISLPVAVDELVTVTVTPSDMTGPWQVELTPGDR